MTKSYHKVWQVLQSVTESVKGITKCDRGLLQSEADITKRDNCYKVRRNTFL